jgi:transcriptional regulator with XRE-family HTH domain
LSRGRPRKFDIRDIPPEKRALSFPYLPEKLEELMRHYGINQDDLAKKSGVQPTAVSKWVTGVGNASISALRLLCVSLEPKTPLWWITGGLETGSLKDAIKKEQEPHTKLQPTDSTHPQAWRELAYEQTATLRYIYSLKTGRNEGVNKAVEDLLDLSADEIVALDNKGIHAYIHPDDDKAFHGQVAHLAQQGFKAKATLRYRILDVKASRETGKEVWRLYEATHEVIQNGDELALLGTAIEKSLEESSTAQPMTDETSAYAALRELEPVLQQFTAVYEKLRSWEKRHREKEDDTFDI